jgi:hypothetical protein
MGKSLGSSFARGVGKGVGKGCFIATAAYGTPMAEEINVLRKWRDENLMKSAPGRLFVNIYYMTSPPIASLISKSDKIRSLTRKLLTPIVNHFNNN